MITGSTAELLNSALDWNAATSSFALPPEREAASSHGPKRCLSVASGHTLFPRSRIPGAASHAFEAYHTDLDQLVSAGLALHFAESPRPRTDPAELAQRFNNSQVPQEGLPAESYFRYLFENVVPHSVRTHDPRFIGHMTSALPAFIGPLGRVMTALNQNVVKLETSDVLAFQERQAVAILHRLVYGREQSFYDARIQHPDSTLGTIVSGGTLGNISALWCARSRRLGSKDGFRGIDQVGISEALAAYGYRRAVVIGSSLMHYSLEKAADLLGFGRQSLIRVPATEHGSINLSCLEKTLRRCAAEGDLILSLIGIAGTTETGAVDPLPEMADFAAAFNCHFHVDAAWGGPVLFSENYRHLLNGIDRADSVAIDGHKQLYLPMGIGITLFRDPELARSVEMSANYIIRAGSADPGRRTIEGSRPAMALYLHGVLHMLGQAGYQNLIDEGIEKAHFLARSIEARPSFELLAEPQLNIVNYRYVPPALRETAQSGSLSAAETATIDDVNRRLQELQRNRGESFISRTTLSNARYGAGSPVISLRAVIANPLTTRYDLIAILDEQTAIGDQISAEIVCGSETRGSAL